MESFKRFFVVFSVFAIATFTALNSKPGQADDIVETAISFGAFTTLVAAAQEAGLIETLKTDDPITVFAPTDRAFASLPDGTFVDLLKPENRAQLRAVLNHHVVPGRIMSKDFSGKKLQVNSLGGKSLTLDATDGVMVGDAHVVQADIITDNGVIHVIDKVVIPQ